MSDDAGVIDVADAVLRDAAVRAITRERDAQCRSIHDPPCGVRGERVRKRCGASEEALRAARRLYMMRACEKDAIDADDEQKRVAAVSAARAMRSPHVRRYARYGCRRNA